MHAENEMSQSDLERSSRRRARENAREQATINFPFTSDW